MSKGPENTFISAIHRHLPASLYRIKNHNPFNSGQADVWYSGSKTDLWVEYKFVVIPKRPDTVIKFGLSPLQLEWLRSRYEEGRNIAVIVGSKDGGVWLPYLRWEEPMTAGKFHEELFGRIALASTIENYVNKG